MFIYWKIFYSTYYYKIFLLLRIGLIIISFVRWRDKYNSISTVNVVYRVIFLDMINIKISKII